MTEGRVKRCEMCPRRPRAAHESEPGGSAVNVRLFAVVVAVSGIGATVEGVAQTVEPRPTTEIRAQAAPALPRFEPAALRLPRTLQRISAVAFSPDGKHLASGHGSYDRDGSIQVWEVTTGKRVGLAFLPNGVSSIAWTPDGKRIAASIWDSTVRIYDFPGLKEQVHISIDRSATRLGVSPDGRHIVTAAEGFSPTDDSRGRVVQIWDAASGALVRKCESEENLFRLGCTAWSPKGQYVAAAGGTYTRVPKGMGRLWVAGTGQEAARLEEFPGYILGIRFFPDDSRVVTAGTDGTIRIFEPATGKAVTQIKAGTLIEGLDVSPDGTLIASGSLSGAITLWDSGAGAKVVDLAAAGPQVMTVAFSPDGTRLASGGADAVLRLWNVEQQQLERELPFVGSDDRPGRDIGLAPSSDGSFVVAACDTGVLRAVDVGLEKQIWQRDAERGKFPTAIAVAPDRKRVLVGYENGAVRLHAAGTGEVLTDLKAMPAGITAVAFADAGGLVAAGDAEGRVQVWDREGKAPRADRQDHQGPVRAIGFAEKASLVTTIGGDGTAVCFALASGEKKAAARLSPEPVSSALISPDGSTALVLGRQLTIWDAVKLALRRNVNLLLNEPNALALSADGANVLVSHPVGTFVEGPEDGIVAAARVTTSREAGAIALSADNRVLFQATERGELLVWQALPPRHSPLARIRRAGNAVAVAVSPDGTWPAAGGDDSQA